MKISKKSQAVTPGQWIIVENARSELDIDPVSISLDGNKYPAFADGRNLMVRCPGLPPGTYMASVRGRPAGKVMIAAS